MILSVEAEAAKARKRQVELMTALAWGDPQFTRNLLDAPSRAWAKYALEGPSSLAIAVLASNAQGSGVEVVLPQNTKMMPERLRTHVDALVREKDVNGETIGNRIRAANEKLKGEATILIVGPDPINEGDGSKQRLEQRPLIDVRDQMDVIAVLRPGETQRTPRTTPGLTREETREGTFARIGEHAVLLEGRWTETTLNAIERKTKTAWCLAQRTALIRVASLGAVVADISIPNEVEWARAGVSPAAAQAVQDAIEPRIVAGTPQRTALAHAMRRAIKAYAVHTRNEAMGASATCVLSATLERHEIEPIARELQERAMPWIIVHRGGAGWWTISATPTGSEACALCASEQVRLGRRGACTYAPREVAINERTEHAVATIAARWMRRLAGRAGATKVAWVGDDAATKTIEEDVVQNPQCAVCGWPRIPGRQERAETLCRVDIGSNLQRNYEMWDEHRRLLDLRIHTETRPLTGRWGAGTMWTLEACGNGKTPKSIEIDIGDPAGPGQNEVPRACEGTGITISEALGEALRCAVAFDAAQWRGASRHGAVYTTAAALASEGKTGHRRNADEDATSERENEQRWWVQARVLRSEEPIWTLARTFLNAVPSERRRIEQATIAADASRGGALLNALLAYAENKGVTNGWKECTVPEASSAQLLKNRGWALSMERNDEPRPVHRRRASARKDKERFEAQATDIEATEAERRCVMRLAAKVMKVDHETTTTIESLEDLLARAGEEQDRDALFQAHPDQEGEWSENAEEGDEGEWMVRTCNALIRAIEDGQPGTLIGVDLNDERQTPYNAVAITTVPERGR